MKLKFVATGVNRSGTVFTARLLTSLGIPCGHESIFNDRGIQHAKNSLQNPSLRHLSFSSTHETFNHHNRIPDWVKASNTVAESSYLIVPFLNWEELRETPLIHIVRNPFKVISSLLGDVHFFTNTNTHNMWEWPIYQFLPELKSIETPVERACYYYVKWNERIEKEKTLRPYFFSQVETLPSKDFFEFINAQPNEKMFNNKQINHFGRRKKNYELTDIPEGEIKKAFIEKVNQYNYRLKKMFL